MKKRLVLMAVAAVTSLSAFSGVYLQSSCGKGGGWTVDRSYFSTPEEWEDYKREFNELYCGPDSGPAIEMPAPPDPDSDLM